jgi:hypothetical protein
MSISEIIDFLLDLMTDEETKREFESDPEAALASRKLDGVSAQDVRDARLVMADSGQARPRPDGGSGNGGGGDDPIREIQHTTNTFEIDRSRTDIDQTVLDLDIDDRDTTVIDSFNGDTENNVVAIQDNDVTRNDIDVVNVEDSFNQTPEEEPVGEEPAGEPAEEPEVSIDPVEEPVLIEEPAPEPIVSTDPVEEGPESEPEPEPVLG